MIKRTMGNFKNTRCRAFLGILLMAAFLPSCSVKEGREDCPCLLEIDSDAFRDEGLEPDISVMGEKGKISLFPKDGLLTARVPKGTYQLSAVSGGARTLIGNQLVSALRETAPDSLYAYASALACTQERLRIRPEPEKQFCTVTLQVGSSEAGDFQFRVRSPCDGFQRFSLEPTSGFHSCLLPENGSGIYRFRILRQNGSEGLSIEVIPEDGLTREIPLGRLMLEAGYDWKQKNLEDFYLKFDPVLSIIQVRISGWETEKTMEITL